MDRLSWFAAAIGFACAAAMAIDVVRRPQKMGVVNIVWPVPGLFGGPPTLCGHLRYGRPRGMTPDMTGSWACAG